MSSDDPTALSAAALAEAVRGRRLKARDVAEAYIARLDQREPHVSAYVHLDHDSFRAQADRIDREGARGLLAGVPLAVKDIIDTADMPTAYGSPIYAGNRPAWDAPAVAVAKAAGVLIPGKAVTTEFASSFAGPTRNPHDPARTPGGSSSGSAAAVADRTAALGFGTQTAGSVLRPASFCGVVGFKGSLNWFPVIGFKALAPSFDTLGLMTRSVADLVLFRDAMLRRKASKAPDALSGPRLGFTFYPDPGRATPAMHAALERAKKAFAARGARVADVTLPPVFAQDLVGLHQQVMTYEQRLVFTWERAAHPEKLSAPFAKQVADAEAVSEAMYRKGLATAAAARAALTDLAANYDAIVMPAAPGEANPIGEGTGDPVFNRTASFLTLPAVSLPNGTGPGGLPLGLQLMGAAGEDERLIAVAAWAEAALSA